VGWLERAGPRSTLAVISCGLWHVRSLDISSGICLSKHTKSPSITVEAHYFPLGRPLCDDPVDGPNNLCLLKPNEVHVWNRDIWNGSCSLLNRARCSSAIYTQFWSYCALCRVPCMTDIVVSAVDMVSSRRSWVDHRCLCFRKAGRYSYTDSPLENRLPAHTRLLLPTLDHLRNLVSLGVGSDCRSVTW